MSENYFKKFAPWVFDGMLILVILLCAFFVRNSFLDSDGRYKGESLWLDEVYSLNYADGGGVVEIVEEVLENKDSHPPFYYLALYEWQNMWGVDIIGSQKFIDQEASGHGFSLFFGLLAVVMIYLCGFVIGGRRVAVGSSVLVSFLFFPVFYSLEIRMYSLVLFLMGLSLYLVWILSEKWSWLRMIGFAAVCVIGLYTHYYFVFWVSALYLFWLSSKVSIRKWIIGVGIGIVFYLPWVFVLLRQVMMKFFEGGESNLTAWLTLPEPSWKIFGILFEEFFYYQQLFGERGVFALIVGFILFSGILLAAIIRCKKGFGKRIVWLFGLGFGFNLLLPYLISVFVSPIIHPRYMQGAFLLLIIFVPFIFSRAVSKWIYYFSIAVFVVFALFILNKSSEKYFHPDWNGFFAEYGDKLDGPIYVSPVYYALSLSYHLERLGIDAEVVEFDYLKDDFEKVFFGDFIFIERLPLPDVVNFLRSKCRIDVENYFERIGFYRGAC